LFPGEFGPDFSGRKDGVGPINTRNAAHLNEIFSSELQLIDFLRFFGGSRATEQRTDIGGQRAENPVQAGAGIVAQNGARKTLLRDEDVPNDPG
jgi:hypothetical protein